MCWIVNRLPRCRYRLVVSIRWQPSELGLHLQMMSLAVMLKVLMKKRNQKKNCWLSESCKAFTVDAERALTDRSDV